MKKTVAYIRVSTTKQDVETQEFEILRYAQSHQLHVSEWMKLEMSSRKSMAERQINTLLSSLGEGDTLLMSEISRLGRSLSEIVGIVERLTTNGVTLIAIKQKMTLNHNNDMTSKIQIALFALMAEIERDLLSARTKMGVQRARAAGKILGRPKNSRSSLLDAKVDTIIELREKGICNSSIAKMLEVTPQAMHYFIKTRNIA